MSSTTHFYPYAAGKSLIESLPSELVRKILDSVLVSPNLPASCHISSWPPGDVNANNIQPPSLMSCLLTSRTMNAMALTLMYRDVAISQSSTFEKFLAQVTKYQFLGESVRRLDLSQIRTIRPEGKWDVWNPLLTALSHTPLLQEFRIHNDTSNALDQQSLQKLFCELPHLKILQLSSCNSPTFTQGFSHVFSSGTPISPSLKSLNLNDCTTLPPAIFSSLLPHLPHLQILNVSNTQITSDALSTIPPTARLTSLNISHCSSLSSTPLADFLATHPAIRNTVTDLNLSTSSVIDPPVLNEAAISKILATIPSTARVLHLKNAPMTPAHLADLRAARARQLTELSVGREGRLRDVERLFASREDVEGDEEVEEEEDEPVEIESKYQSVLSPMMESVAVCKIRQRINAVEGRGTGGERRARLRYLDISSLSVVEQGKMRTSVLLGKGSLPLEVIEIGEAVVRSYEMLPRVAKAVGWEVKSVGKRCWLRRIEGR